MQILLKVEKINHQPQWWELRQDSRAVYSCDKKNTNQISRKITLYNCGQWWQIGAEGGKWWQMVANYIFIRLSQIVANRGKLETNGGKWRQIRDNWWQINFPNSSIHVDGCHGSFTYGSKSIYDYFPIQLGFQSSQWTKSYFSEGLKPTTNQLFTHRIHVCHIW